MHKVWACLGLYADKEQAPRRLQAAGGPANNP